MSKLFKVLITGSIGAGKSSACKLFGELGVPVFYSDEAARSLMDTNPFIMMNVKKAFGDDIYVKKYVKKNISVKEELDRKKLAEIVFNDPDKLKKLNKIVHPWVGESFKSFCFEYEEYGFKYPDVHYVIEESAIAVEMGMKDKFDYIVVVTADEEIRAKRTMERDSCAEEQVREKMNSQLSDEEKIKHADAVIINNDFPNLECQVKSIHKKILEDIKK
jgi:dephospho-CoA kinase